jgi:ABC-2 type transport system permease protein
MVDAAPSAALTPLQWDGPAKFVRDTWLTFQRQILLLQRMPVRIVLTFVYPVTYMVIYAPLLKGALSAQGVTTYVEAFRVYVPGLLAYTALVSGLITGFILLAEIHSGIIERSRVLPVSRASLMLGRALREVASLLFQGVVITVLALFWGLTVGIGGLLLCYLLMALVALLSVSLSYAVTLKIRSARAVGSILGTGSQPVMLVSGMLLPLTLAPLWMVDIARVNPFYWATSGMRDLFAGSLGATAVWVSFAVMVPVTALVVTWCLRLFAREIR